MENAQEYWRPVVGYESLYEVSNLGRVKSLVQKSERIMSLKLETVKNKKYRRLSVMLCKDGVRKRCKVHRLVALAFLPNPNNLPEVNHKDENALNNSVWVNTDGSVDPDKSNLEWCDRWYNTHYGNITQKISDARKTKILQIDGNKVVKEWDSISEASISMCGKNTGNIWFSLKKGTKAFGYSWIYADDKGSTTFTETMAARRL